MPACAGMTGGRAPAMPDAQLRSIAFAAASSASTIAWICSGVAARPRRRRRSVARRLSIARLTETKPANRPSSLSPKKRAKMASIWALLSARTFSPVGRQRIELAALRVLARAGVAHLLEHGQGRIDDAGAWRIFAPDPLAEVLDDLVAVAGLFRHQPEDNEPELAAVEHPALAALQSAMAAAPAAERPAPETAMVAVAE